MAMMADDFQISEHGDPPTLQNNPDKLASHFFERETKKKRLRELREMHDCVRSIVNHMGKYYRTKDPPPWLDLRLVAGQILRSGATRRGSHHAAWKYLKDSMTSIHAWMDGHDNWKGAVEASKMPHLGFRSEIKATEFIESKSDSLPKCLMNSLKQIKLDFLMDPQPPSNDNTPYFWRGADIDDPVWRSQFMQRQTYYHHIPFDDDLTDLVLSAVCQKGKAELENAQGLEEEAGADEEDEHCGPYGKEAAATADGKMRGSRDNDRTWEDRVQATMSRIAATVNEALAAEKSKLLGKRKRQENEKIQVEAQNKTQKPTEGGPRQQRVMDSIEDSDDDDHLPTPPFAKGCAGKEDEKYQALKAGYKKLKKQDQRLASLYSSLGDNIKKQENDVEQLTKQQKDLRKDTDANKLKQQQLAERIAELETENKSLEEKTQQLTIQCSALTNDVRKLEDRSGQVEAQCSALQDENKILRCQLVSLITRVEDLESAPKPMAEPVQTAASAPVSPPEPAKESASVRSRQDSVVEASGNGGGAGPRDFARGAAAPTVASSQWQSAGAVKYEYMDGLSMDQPPQRRYTRAGSRFPRVLDMPTFNPTWNPQQEILEAIEKREGEREGEWGRVRDVGEVGEM
ncbi:hypothetical protein B0I37DRAFT_403704 [Chaetomium sp. MPI-CAGE-AT-0009]|nr:hypothetical protein B0I37DRAFT_403704 [Chaetomium sp. MPI-CAGE-AT-0009]